MKKTAPIGLIVAVIIAIGVIATLSYGGGPKGNDNNTSITVNSQNTTVVIPKTFNNATTTVSTQNATGRHFDVTLQEQVGMKQK